MKVVEPMMIPPGAKVFPLSVEAYRLLGEAGSIPKNTELLYGVVYNKVSKSPLHSSLVLEFLDLLHENLPPGHFLMSEQPIACSDSEPEPDIAVVRGAIGDFRQCHPQTAELVVEVCVTSHDYDRSKLRAYAGGAVKEVWLLLVPERQVEVYSQPVGGNYGEKKTIGPGGKLVSAALPNFALDLDSFFQP